MSIVTGVGDREEALQRYVQKVYHSHSSVTMNKATFASAAASSIMNHKPATTTTTSQIAVVHLSSSNPTSVTSTITNGKAGNGVINYTNAGAKGVVGNRNRTVGGPAVPPKPSMISYRNGLPSEPVDSLIIKLSQSKQQHQQSDQSDKSLTEDDSTGSPVPPDARAKQVLKEAVNAVVNSFAKHSQGGYGRGEFV